MHAYVVLLFALIAIDWKDGKKHKYGRLSEPPSQYQGMKWIHPVLPLLSSLIDFLCQSQQVWKRPCSFF